MTDVARGVGFLSAGAACLAAVAYRPSYCRYICGWGVCPPCPGEGEPPIVVVRVALVLALLALGLAGLVRVEIWRREKRAQNDKTPED